MTVNVFVLYAKLIPVWHNCVLSHYFNNNIPVNRGLLVQVSTLNGSPCVLIYWAHWWCRSGHDPLVTDTAPCFVIMQINQEGLTIAFLIYAWLYFVEISNIYIQCTGLNIYHDISWLQITSSICMEYDKPRLIAGFWWVWSPCSYKCIPTFMKDAKSCKWHTHREQYCINRGK